MIVLAVDTATKAASAALIDNGEIRSEFLINNRTMHSRNLMPLVEEAVKAAGIKKSDIDLFASTVGPGSFTGVRIGVATVKAMAYALKKPVVGINTLDCLAYDVCEYEKMICPVLDARNEQVFCAVYRKDENNTLERLTDYMGIPIEELMELLEGYQKDVIFTGDAYEMCLRREPSRKFRKYGVHRGAYMPKASTVGLMALHEPFTDPALLKPFYLRMSQAERLMGSKNE